jgi:hypothetical protein
MMLPVGDPADTGIERDLGWYRHLVHNRSVPGSLFTLLHLPFMLAFLSLALLGTFTVMKVDLTVLLLSLAAVASMLYGEHMLDDTTGVGKPWKTVFSDRTLTGFGVGLYILAFAIGAYASYHFATLLPIVGVSLGIVFCTLYGLEKWKFHQVWFGALGMGAIATFSYLAQTVITGQAADASVAMLLLGAGFAYSYVLLGLYEHTKRDGSKVIWNMLGGQFALSYILGLAVLWFR